MQKEILNLASGSVVCIFINYFRGFTQNGVTSGEACLYCLAPRHHSSVKPSQWWRAFGALVSKSVEAQTSRTNRNVLNHYVNWSIAWCLVTLGSLLLWGKLTGFLYHNKIFGVIMKKIFRKFSFDEENLRVFGDVSWTCGQDHDSCDF